MMALPVSCEKCSASARLVTNGIFVHLQVVERLLKQLEVKKKDLSDFQERYKIRIKVSAQITRPQEGC